MSDPNHSPQPTAPNPDDHLALTVRARTQIGRLLSADPQTQRQALRDEWDRRFEETRTAMEAGRASGSRLLDRSLSTIGPRHAGLQQDLPRLAQQLRDLDPNRRNPVLGLVRRLPFVRLAEREAMRLQTGRSHIDQLVAQLAGHRQRLAEDHEAMELERDRLRASITQLQTLIAENEAMAGALDDGLRTTELTPAWRDLLVQELKLPLQQRIADLRTSYQVAQDALLSTELIQRNNRELMVGTNRVSTIAVAAMESALTNASAIDGQMEITESLALITKATEATMLNNARQLRKTTGQIHTQAGSSMLNVATLAQTAREIDQAAADLNTLRAQMGTKLEGELQRLKALNGAGTVRLAAGEQARELLEQTGPR